MKKTIDLNPEQQIAVNAARGGWCVQAGAGSGKTSVLIARYEKLIKERANPDDILVLTFTAEAAKNLRKRAEGLGIEKSGNRTSGFMTFHSLALSFAVQEREAFPFRLAEFPLASDAQVNKSISEIARRFTVDPKLLRSQISVLKRTRVSPEEAVKKAEQEGAGEKTALAYKAYESGLTEMGVLDFDSLLVWMVRILEQKANLRQRWQFSWVMVDECQDNDRLQWRLLQLLSEENKNIFAVGDPGQNLYSFRGADVESFINFNSIFPNSKILYLAKNHRSSKNLVDFLKLVGPHPELAEKFFTDNAEGPDPIITKHSSVFEEANEIVRQIKEGVVLNPDSVAILSRTNRGLMPFETALATAGIRYKNLGKAGFFSATEVVSIMSYLQCVVAPLNHSVLSTLRSPFEPTKFLRKKEIADHLTAEAKRTGDSIWKCLHNYTPKDLNQMRSLQAFKNFLFALTKYKDSSAADAVKGIIKDTRAMGFYAEGESADVDKNPTENLGELVKAAGRFKTVPEFLDHFRKVQGAAKSKKGVVVGTCHAAKGLEWPDVYLVSCEEGILPHAKCESVAEEARVFFVGVSRAERRLTISYTGTPSRFLTRFIPPPADLDDFWEETNETTKNLAHN